MQRRSRKMLKFVNYVQGEQPETLVIAEEETENVKEDWINLYEPVLEAGKYIISARYQSDDPLCQIAYTTGGLKELTLDAADKIYKVLKKYSPNMVAYLANMIGVHTQLGAVFVTKKNVSAVVENLKEIFDDEENYEPASR
jgi:hypothetical protein